MPLPRAAAVAGLLSLAGCQIYMDGGAGLLRSKGLVRAEQSNLDGDFGADSVVDSGEGRELSASSYAFDLGGYIGAGRLPIRLMSSLWSAIELVNVREEDPMGGLARLHHEWQPASLVTLGVSLAAIKIMGHQIAPYGFYGHNWIISDLQKPFVNTRWEVGVEVCGNYGPDNEEDDLFEHFCLRVAGARHMGRPISPDYGGGNKGDYTAEGVFFMFGMRSAEFGND